MRAERLAQWLTVRQPALGLRLAAALGDLAVRFSDTARTPPPDDVREIFGFDLDAAAVWRIRRDIARLYFRNRALRGLVHELGLNAILPLIHTVRAEPLLRLRAERVPIVVVGWHQGPARAASVAFQKIGVPALFAVVAPPREAERDGLVRWAELIGEMDSARFLKRADRAIRDGAVVGLNLDSPVGREPAVFLERRIRVARGPAALARILGARLVPVTRRFPGAGPAIEVTFHEPIADADLDRNSGAAFERALLARAARWFEADSLTDPGSQRPEWLARLIDAPPLSEEEAGPKGAAAASQLAERYARRVERRRARARAEWERSWAVDLDTPWRGRSVSPEIREAVATGWFPPGGRALDAGCGEGDVAAWLAERGFRCVGVDIAEAAVARARASFGERVAELTYARADLCEGVPGGPFAIVVDRGCFLQIAEHDRANYARAIVAACSPDARLLLFDRAFRGGISMGDPNEIERKRAELIDAFGAHFSIERVAPTYLDRHGGRRADECLPGIVFWMRRKNET
jgi:SAM-dependent methyltransferase/lauroyl/myristoyl acyltransferase